MSASPDRFASLRRRFRDRLVEADAALPLLAADPAGHSRLQDLAHKLAGAGGSFGFPDVSDAAAVVDCAIARSGRCPDTELRALERAVRDALEASEP